MLGQGREAVRQRLALGGRQDREHAGDVTGSDGVEQRPGGGIGRRGAVVTGEGEAHADGAEDDHDQGDREEDRAA